MFCLLKARALKQFQMNQSYLHWCIFSSSHINKSELNSELGLGWISSWAAPGDWERGWGQDTPLCFCLLPTLQLTYFLLPAVGSKKVGFHSFEEIPLQPSQVRALTKCTKRILRFLRERNYPFALGVVVQFFTVNHYSGQVYILGFCSNSFLAGLVKFKINECFNKSHS